MGLAITGDKPCLSNALMTGQHAAQASQPAWRATNVALLNHSGLPCNG